MAFCSTETQFRHRVQETGKNVAKMRKNGLKRLKNAQKSAEIQLTIESGYYIIVKRVPKSAYGLKREVTANPRENKPRGR